MEYIETTQSGVNIWVSGSKVLTFEFQGAKCGQNQVTRRKSGDVWVPGDKVGSKSSFREQSDDIWVSGSKVGLKSSSNEHC